MSKERKTRPNGEFYSSDPSERALQLKEDGKIGPQFGAKGGRPRKKRATEMAAEKARAHADQITKVFLDGIDEEQPMRMRLAAANSWLGIEQEEAKLQLQEEKHDLDLENASRDDLIGFLADALTQGNLAEAVGPIIDAESEDITNVAELGHRPSETDGDGSQEVPE